jgi:spermidine synthase
VGAKLRLLIYLLFLASGATALVYQVAWTRSLSLVFGASFEAISIVLAAFMAGLAAGGVWFGRRASRFARPLRVYGYLEIGVALLALALPLLLRGVTRAYVEIAFGSGAPGWPVGVARGVLAFAALVPATFCMGGTLPLLVHFLVRRRDELGGRLSRLYAVNTLGAVIGTLGTAFVLLPELGVWGAQLLAVAGNLGIGVAAIAADRRAGALGGAGARATSGAGTTRPAPAERPHALWGLRVAFLGAGVSGLGALALEVMWARSLAVATGSTTYGFAIMLAAFLVGISLGSSLYALLPRRRLHEGVQLGGILVLIGLASLLVSRWIPRLPEYALELNARLYGGAVGVRGGTTLVLSFLVMLLPCTFMGLAFPLAGQVRARLRGHVAESAGDLLGLNTTGAILGSLLAGFVLVPVLGLQRGMVAVCALYVGYGLLVLCTMAGSLRPRLRGPATVAALLSIGLAAALPARVRPWDVRLLAAFSNNRMDVFVAPDGRVDPDRFLERAQVLYYREGRGSTVSVIDTPANRTLHVDGKIVASDGRSDLRHELLLGHLPVLLHPDPHSALVVGLGAGVTLAGVAAHAEIEKVTVVEIEPAVVGAAEHFAHVNDAALHDPRVRLVYQDGRNFLLTTRDRFDVITADPIHPWARGAAYLFTDEYYRLVRERLTEGGVMCQWLPLYELSPANVRSVVATFAANFEHTSLWQATADVLLIGSAAPLEVDLEALARRLEAPAVSAHLASVDLDDPLLLLAEFALDDAAARRFAAGARINTDDNLYLEFSSPLTVGDPRVLHENLALIDSSRASPAALLRNPSERFGSPEEAEATLRLYQWAKSETVRASLAGRGGARRRSSARLLEGIERLRRVSARLPAYGPARRLLAARLTDLGALQAGSGKLDLAVTSFREAVAANPGSASAYNGLGAALGSQGRYAEALDPLRRAIKLEPAYAEAHANLAAALQAQGRLEEAIPHLRRAHRLGAD